MRFGNVSEGNAVALVTVSSHCVSCCTGYTVNQPKVVLKRHFIIIFDVRRNLEII